MEINAKSVYLLVGSLFCFLQAQGIDNNCATCTRESLDSANLIINPVRVNQVGYRTDDKHKRAYVADPLVNTFSLLRANNSVAYSGTLNDMGDWKELDGTIEILGFRNSITQMYHLSRQSDGNEHLYYADFGGFSEEGTYRIAIGADTSVPFAIRETIYNDVFELALKFFGIQRSGDNDSWFHKPSHLLDGSARGPGKEGSLAGGWYDCGDHFKVSQTNAYTFTNLILAYTLWPQKAEDRYGSSYNDTIPFGNEGIPDVLREAKIGADYVMRLYKASVEDGLIEQNDMYQQVGVVLADHSYWDKPEMQDAQPLSKGGPPRQIDKDIGGDVSSQFAGALAMFAKAWEPFDPVYAAECLKAAKTIYHQISIPNYNNPGFADGSFYIPQGRIDDDLAMGALGLWYATGDTTYKHDLMKNTAYGNNPNYVHNLETFQAGFLAMHSSRLFSPGGWTFDYQNTFIQVIWSMYNLFYKSDSLASTWGISKEEAQDMRLRIHTLVRKRYLHESPSGTTVVDGTGGSLRVNPPYNLLRVSEDWGFNRYNMGVVIAVFAYWDMIREDSTAQAGTYYNIGIDNMNYVLGMNPWDLSFLMGAGTKNLQHPHHRAANPEGYNAGGIPYDYRHPKGAFMAGTAPGKTLLDEWGKYTVTETCIDYSAQLILISQLLAKDLPPDVTGPKFSNIVVRQVTKNSATISWETDELSRDTLFYSLTPGGVIAGKAGTTVSKDKVVTLTGLDPNTTYYFFLEGMDIYRNIARDNNKGLWYSFTTTDKELPPAEISDVRVCNITHNSATVYWWTKNGAYSSRVDYSSDSAHFTDTKLTKDGDDEGGPVLFHKVTLTKLKPDTRYWFDVVSGNTVSDNSGNHFSFKTTDVFVDYTIRMKPTKKGNGSAHFYVEIANNEMQGYAGVKLHFYFNADPVTAAGIVARGFDNQLFNVSGIASQIVVNYGKATTLDGFTNTWYIPITISDTLPVASRARIELQINGGGAWGTVPFSQFADAWSVIPHNEPVQFGGIDLSKGLIYDGPDEVDTVNGVSTVTYVNNPYITAYYNGKHVYGYPPDWKDNLPESHKTVQLFLDKPVKTPQQYLETDTFRTQFAGFSWSYPHGMISDIEINASGIPFTKISGRDDSVSFATGANLQYGPNLYTVVSWHNKKGEDCACAYRNLTVEVDTVKAPLIPRFIKTDPSDSLQIYQSKRGLVHISLVDSTDSIITAEDIAITLSSNYPSIQFFQTAESSSPISSINLLNGKADVFVSGAEVITDGLLSFSAANPRAENTYNTASIRCIIVPRPLWPVINSAKALDADGDLSVNIISVVISEVFKDGQHLSGAVVQYLDTEYVISATSIIADNTFLTIPLPAGLREDPVPTGIVHLNIDVEGEIKQESIRFTDGIGPALKTALLSENTGSALDTLKLTTSETVSSQSLTGASLQLIKRGTGDTLTLTVAGINASAYDDHMVVTTMPAGAIRPQEGDMLRLLPGELNGTIIDFTGNKPHLLNIPVIIRARPALLNEAAYFDTDGNGFVETVNLTFSRNVLLDDISATVYWGDKVFRNITGNQISSSTIDSSVVVIKIPEYGIDSITPKTSGDMIVTVGFNSFPEDIREKHAADSAAPVILKAIIAPAVSYNELSSMQPDTMTVFFSEEVKITGTQNPFLFLHHGNTPYTCKNEIWSQNQNSAKFMISNVQGGIYPITGDSIRINAFVISDTSAVYQNNLNNRYAPVTVLPVKMKWNITVGPNPFSPLTKTCAISIKPQGRFRGELQVSASLTIYDAMGNKVITKMPLQKISGNASLYYHWDGRNSRGRMVGNGTYLGLLKVKEDSNESEWKIKIGVKK